MRKKILFIVVTFAIGCTHYFPRDSSRYILTKEELEFLKSKKIGLIGFYPFDYKLENAGIKREIALEELKIENQRHLEMVRLVNNNFEKKEILNESKNHFTWDIKNSQFGASKLSAFFNKENRTISLLEFGTDLQDIKPMSGIKIIQESKLKRFLEEYLIKTKHLGLEVMEKLFSFSSSDSNSEELRMKEFDIDYWIVGYHGPNYGNNQSSVLYGLTIIPFTISLGIFPVVSYEETESIFWVFDKDLNLLKKIEYRDGFYSLTSWLALGGAFDGYGISKGIPSPNVYESDIKQFSKEFVKLVRK